ncbi:MAG: hypothetical protein KAV87_53155 [Desulfobacteraceae bacterium]|nr:hypothetical protein [Desulfobacteraceae bacterium]
MRIRVLFLIVVMATSFLSSVSFAKGESISLEHNGIKGRWFPGAMVDKMQGDIVELDALRLSKIEMNVQLKIRMGRIEDLQLALSAANEIIVKAKSGIVIAENSAKANAARAVVAEESERSLRDQYGVWYRQPVLCVSVGAVGVVVVEIVIYFLLK